MGNDDENVLELNKRASAKLGQPVCLDFKMARGTLRVSGKGIDKVLGIPTPKDGYTIPAFYHSLEKKFPYGEKEGVYFTFKFEKGGDKKGELSSALFYEAVKKSTEEVFAVSGESSYTTFQKAYKELESKEDVSLHHISGPHLMIDYDAESPILNIWENRPSKTKLYKFKERVSFRVRIIDKGKYVFWQESGKALKSSPYGCFAFNFQKGYDFAWDLRCKWLKKNLVKEIKGPPVYDKYYTPLDYVSVEMSEPSIR